MSENIKLIIAFEDPDLDDEERDEEVRRLLNQMREMEEIEGVNRVLDPSPPEGKMAAGGFLLNLLTAEVSLANFKRLMAFLGDRLRGKIIEIEVEANGRKLKAKVSSREELAAVIQELQKFTET